MKKRTDVPAIEPYLTDESNAFHAASETIDGLYLPQNRTEVVEVVVEANRTRTPVTTSGAGTGITGARVPVLGGTILSTESLLTLETAKEPMQWRLSTYDTMVGQVSIALDADRRSARVPAGVPLEVLQSILPDDLFYPPDPTEQSALMGATVATNASGARSFHYGPTRAWVRALQLVLPTGDTLDIQRDTISSDSQGRLAFSTNEGAHYQLPLPSYQMPRIKNAAGLYVEPGMDLVDLFIGSEGLLGVITEVTVALAPKPGEIVGSIVFFPRDEDAQEFAAALRRMREQGVLSIEYFDEYSLQFLTDSYPELRSEFKAAISIEVNMKSESMLDELAVLMEKHNASNDWSATNEKEFRRQREFRHAVPEAVNTYLRHNNSYKMATDFVVPEQQFFTLVNLYQEAGAKFRRNCPRKGLHYTIFGHIGDCHLHFNFIGQSPQEMEVVKALYAQLAQSVLALGGTISGEHGVGKKTVQLQGKEIPYLELMYGQAGLREIARLKQQLDPNCILNVGNMIPPPTSGQLS